MKYDNFIFFNKSEVQGKEMIITDELNTKGERTLTYFL